VCLTNMATVAADIDPVAVFCDLRTRYPTPYATLLHLPGLAVISASPERFVRVHTDGRIESKPMKGTRPRGTTAGMDEELRCALRRSEKDRAENLMIVDLVRNDLSQVCEPGSVHVAELFEIESFASVHQMVSTVRGVLRRDAGVIDAIRALFPAGSMTGAPKIRTMRILDDLEGAARGIYSGAIGYLSLSGAADLSVAIRTMVSCEGQVHFGIGGAVTSLSDHAEEWAETMVKAVSSLQVLGIEDIARDTSVQGPGGLPAVR
jgi:para-aminobenzoate synthetase